MPVRQVRESAPALSATSRLTGLISQAAGAVDASAWTAGITALIVTAAIVIVLRAFGTAPTVLPSTPSDSWCCPAEPVDVPKSRVG